MVRIFGVSAFVLALVACNAIGGIEPATLDTSGTAPDPLSDPGLPSSPPGAPGACDPSSALCNNRCASPSDPSFGCGDPACAPCSLTHARAACSGGRCVLDKCAPGFADCNGDPADGCEVDVSTADHCGACGVACTGDTPVCSGGRCASGCSAKTNLCDKACVDLRNDPRHCGSCGNACPAAPPSGVAACASGACHVTCADGLHLCGGACVDNTSVASCGASCTACPTAANAFPTCDGKACAWSCSTGFASCDRLNANGCEVTLGTDPANCGACGNACAVGKTCVSGACQ